MRVFTLLSFLFLLGSGSANAANSTVYITVSTELRDELIASVTAQWVGTVGTSLFAGDRKIVVTGKRDGYQPPILDPIENASAMDRCFVHGFAFGMEEERRAVTGLLDGLYNDVLVTETCDGVLSSGAGTFLEGCMHGYGVAKSTITLRDQSFHIIFDPVPNQ